jgi:hypothetical protein
VTLSGAGSGSTTTGAGGTYTFSDAPLGGYTVSISDFTSDVSFVETTKPATLSSEGQVVPVDFTGTHVRTASISGQVQAFDPFYPDGVSGVTVTAVGPDGSATATTNSSGDFFFGSRRSGAYTVSISGMPTELYFPTTLQSLALGVGEAQTGVDFLGIYPGPFDTWDITLPSEGVSLCDGTGSPGSCSGVSSVLIRAEVRFPASELLDPWEEVYFEYRVPGSSTLTGIGSTTTFTYADQGAYRSWSCEITLYGDSSLPTGPIEIIATGVGGDSNVPTVPNTEITVVAGTVSGGAP